jgi:hypothetical protein
MQVNSRHAQDVNGRDGPYDSGGATAELFSDTVLMCCAHKTVIGNAWSGRTSVETRFDVLLRTLL